MTLYVHEVGNGKKRGLWLHGWLGSGKDGEALQKRRGTDTTLLCPDLPGHGQSPIAGVTLFETLDLLSELAGDCEWAGGYSMGGRLLMMAAARNPDAFQTLVIESASLGLSDATEREIRRDLDHQRAEELKTQGLEGFCDSWYQMDMWGGFQDFPKREGRETDLADALEKFSVGWQPDLRTWIKTTTCRILWLAGARDPKYAEQAAWVQKQTRHQVEILNTGHNVHMQEPEEWRDVVTPFLYRIPFATDQ